ncbi:hypothetical protein ERJ75_000522100 [Trypanosoma vivax]|nr:hypothetical protein ERJ75_000522100 [Trypanosoma vivax]
MLLLRRNLLRRFERRTLICAQVTFARRHTQDACLKGGYLSNFTTLARIIECLEKKNYDGVAHLYDSEFHVSNMSLIEFAGGASHARDVALCLMRAFTALGRMDRVREVFMIGLRDLQSRRNTSYRGAPDHNEAADRSVATLNTSFFNTYLEVLTRRKNFANEEVLFVLREMRTVGVAPDALTYHYLIELHIRMGVDPVSLWNDMRREAKVDPLPCTIQALLLEVVPSSPDTLFVVDVTREALKHGSSVMDKRLLAEMMEQWLRKSQDYPPEYVLWLMFELELRCVVDKSSFVQFVQKQHVAELLQRCANVPMRKLP